MSILAHATLGSTGFDAEKRAMASQAQHEIIEAKRIQADLGCSWTQALKVASGKCVPFWEVTNDADSILATFDTRPQAEELKEILVSYEGRKNITITLQFAAV